MLACESGGGCSACSRARAPPIYLSTNYNTVETALGCLCRGRDKTRTYFIVISYIFVREERVM